jgi:membrane-associated phospholipid phosphatase
VAYVLVMAFALVYTAEHYVIDILLGWALAAVVIVVVKLFEARRLKPDQEDAEVQLSFSP